MFTPISWQAASIPACDSPREVMVVSRILIIFLKAARIGRSMMMKSLILSVLFSSRKKHLTDNRITLSSTMAAVVAPSISCRTFLSEAMRSRMWVGTMFLASFCPVEVDATLLPSDFLNRNVRVPFLLRDFSGGGWGAAAVAALSLVTHSARSVPDPAINTYNSLSSPSLIKKAAFACLSVSSILVPASWMVVFGSTCVDVL
eukprot:Lithocolla_globosa_v1_NODE_5730_length_1194_cov_24.330992.p2 type:complete len:202 gc:universal NODE_5730_length_1194_cov_24.330992:319-924(+)